MEAEYVNLGDIIAKNGEGETIIINFPHEEPSERANYPERKGRDLGPACLNRFFSLIAKVQNKKGKISTIGDVLRPKQNIHVKRRKYYTLKTLFSFEELLDLARQTIFDRIFSLGRSCLFISSIFETIFPVYQAFGLANPNTQTTVLIFSPFAHLQSHYDIGHIRNESAVRKLGENLNSSKDIIHILGVHKSRLFESEVETLDKLSNVHLTFDEDLNQELVLQSVRKILNESQNVLVAFSFCAAESSSFKGCNHPNSSSLWNSRSMLSLAQLLGSSPNVKSLQFSDYNPRQEDYASGILFSNLLFAFLNEKYQLL